MTFLKVNRRKLARFQKNLKYNFDGIYSYTTKIAHFDLPARTIVKLGGRSQKNTTHYNYTRQFLEDHHGFQERNNVKLMYSWTRCDPLRKLCQMLTYMGLRGSDAKITKYAELGNV